MIKNSIFIGISRLIARILGLLSTFIVARILLPEDYAVIATCMLVQDFANRVENIGFGQNIISKESLSPHFIGSVFRMRLILGFFLFIIVFSLSGIAADFFNNANVDSVLKVISILFLIRALNNLNIVIEVRKKNFIPTIKVELFSKFISIITTIYFAYTLENYWALSIGMLVYGVVSLIASYFVVKPIFPVLYSRVEAKGIIGFSKWYFFQQIIEYFNAKVNELLTARVFENKILGYFSLGSQVSFIYSHEICNAIDKANISDLSEKKRCCKNNFNEILERNYSTIMAVKTLVLSPVYLFFIFYPEFFIRLLLGNNWLEMADYFVFFSISAFIHGYTYTFQSYFTVFRIPKMLFYSSIMMLFLRVLVLLIAYLGKDPMVIAIGANIIQFFMMVFMCSLFIYYTDSKFKNTVRVICREVIVVAILSLFYLFPIFYGVSEIRGIAISLNLIILFLIFMCLLFPQSMIGRNIFYVIKYIKRSRVNGHTEI